MAEILEDRAQRDGRRWITERHDIGGDSMTISYLAEAGIDAVAAAEARTVFLAQQAQASEILRIVQMLLNAEVASMPRHATMAQVGAAVREAYRTLRAWPLIVLSAWLHTRSDAELREWFGVRPTGLTQLRAKLQQRATIKQQIESEQGD